MSELEKPEPVHYTSSESSSMGISTEPVDYNTPTECSGISAQLHSMSCINGAATITHLLTRYTALVKADPHMYRGAESLLSTLSYLATNRVPIEIIELLYMSSNLLRYLNDKILSAGKQPPQDRGELESDLERLEQMLQVLQCVEVFVELIARRLGGSPLKWLVVAILAAVKTSIRLCLIYQHNQIIVGSFTVNDTQKGWVGPRSGIFFKQSHPNSNIPHQIPNKDLILAELCYTLRPIVHLTALGLFKSKSWIPFTLALGLDVFSFKSLQKIEHPTDRQANELSRRKIAFLLYLFRTPFYNEITEHRLTPVLDYVSKIPIVGLFTDGITDYLPDWQKIYSYVWGS